MDFFRQLSDDQFALLGCAGALGAAFTVMAVSYHIGRLVRGDQQTPRIVRIESPTPAGAAAQTRTKRAA